MTGSPLEAIEATLEEIRELAFVPRTAQVIYEKAVAALEIVRGVGVPTTAQQAAYDCIRLWNEEFGEMPTYREIAGYLGCGTTNAYRLVKGLEGRGLVRLGRSYTARSLRLVGNVKTIAARE